METVVTRFNVLRFMIGMALALAFGVSTGPAAAQAQAPPAGVLDAVTADAVERAAVAPETVDVLRTEAVIWENGCLGFLSSEPCPGALVPGYVVWLTAGAPPVELNNTGEVLVYHTNEDGSFVRLSGADISIGEVPTAALPEGATPRPDALAGFTGDPPAPGSIALLVTAGEATAAALVQALGDVGCSVSALAVLDDGQWLVHLPGAPAQVNAQFPPSLASTTPFFVRCAPN